MTINPFFMDLMKANTIIKSENLILLPGLMHLTQKVMSDIVKVVPSFDYVLNSLNIKKIDKDYAKAADLMEAIVIADKTHPGLRRVNSAFYFISRTCNILMELRVLQGPGRTWLELFDLIVNLRPLFYYAGNYMYYRMSIYIQDVARPRIQRLEEQNKKIPNYVVIASKAMEFDRACENGVQEGKKGRALVRGRVDNRSLAKISLNTVNTQRLKTLTEQCFDLDPKKVRHQTS